MIVASITASYEPFFRWIVRFTDGTQAACSSRELAELLQQ